MPKFEELLHSGWNNLFELDIAVVELICEWLHVRKKIFRSSELGIDGAKSERLLKICQHFGAEKYLSGDSAADYLDVELFASKGISVEWQRFNHPVYPQLHGEFIPYLSVLDMILNVGDKGLEFILNKGSV